MKLVSREVPCAMCGRVTRRLAPKDGALYCQDRSGCRKRFAKMARAHTVLLLCPAKSKADMCVFSGTAATNEWTRESREAHLTSDFHRTYKRH